MSAANERDANEKENNMSVKKTVLAFAGVALCAVSSAAPLKADFAKETGRVNRALHSSGFAPMVWMLPPRRRMALVTP